MSAAEVLATTIDKADKSIEKNAPPFMLTRGDEAELSEVLLSALGADRVVHAEGRFWTYQEDRGVYVPGEDVFWDRLRRMAGAPVVGGTASKTLKVNAATITGTLAILQRQVRKHRFFEDAPTGLLFANGFLRLKDGGIHFDAGHKPDRRARFAYAFDFNQEATAPRFERFLEEIFAPDEDREAKKACLLEFFGVCLFGEAPRFEKCLLLEGTSAANGKSTLLSAMESVFPEDAVSHIALHDLENTVHRAGLAARLLNISSETARVNLESSATFKAAISGDKLEAARKYEQPFDFRPVAGHVFAANELPRVNDRTPGFWRRLIVLPFTRSFEGDKDRDPDLRGKLHAEAPGIVALLCRHAAQALRRGEYTIPPSSKDAMVRWRLDTDEIEEWVSEHTESSAEGTPTEKLHEKFVWWWQTGGRNGRAPSVKKFGMRLNQLGHTKNGHDKLRPLRVRA